MSRTGSTQVQLGDFEETDLRPAADLYAPVFNAAPWHDLWTADTAYRRLADLWTSPGAVGVTARAAGLLVGFVVAQREQWYEGEHCYLREMCVSTDQQRTGVGSGLLAALADRLPPRTHLYLLTARGTGAESFYRSHGFVVSERMAMLGRTLN